MAMMMTTTVFLCLRTVIIALINNCIKAETFEEVSKFTLMLHYRMLKETLAQLIL
jgi:hypothetical protein